MLTVVIAPDKFKGTHRADEVAAAIRDGVRRACPGAACVLAPMADGGEGSGAILAARLGLAEIALTCADPLGRPREGRAWQGDRIVVVELAQFAGLGLLRDEERDPLRTTSYGVGEALVAAGRLVGGACGGAWSRHGVPAGVWLCAGGSATVDGGMGCLQALGWAFYRDDGSVIDAPARGADLDRVARAVAPADEAVAVPVTVLCDVTNPLLGSDGAARVFGPQKGADAATVARLEAGLSRLADALCAATGARVAALRHGGAAGGIAAGLAAGAGARLVAGFDVIAGTAGLGEAMEGADLCATGEGRIDGQTRYGKVVAGVAEIAARHGVPVTAFCGTVDEAESNEALARRLGVERIVACAGAACEPASLGDISRAAEAWARTFLAV